MVDRVYDFCEHVFYLFLFFFNGDRVPQYDEDGEEKGGVDGY